MLMQSGMALSLPWVRSIGPLHVSAIRFAYAAFLAAAWACVRDVRGWNWQIGLVAIPLGTAMAGMGILFAVAIARIPLGLATSIEFLGPMAVAVVSRRKPVTLLLAMTAMAGVLLILGVHESVDMNVGTAAAFAAACCWAAYIVTTKKLANASAGGVHGYAFALSTAAIVSALASPMESSSVMVDLHSAAWLAAVAILYPLLPYAMELTALRTMTKHRFGMLTSMEPVVAVAIGAVILGQSLSRWQSLGVLLIVLSNAGVAFFGRPRK